MISSRAYFPSLEYFIHLHNAFQCQCLIPRRSTLISVIWHLQLLVTLARGESPSLPTFWNDGGRRDCAGRPPDGVMLSSRWQLIKNLRLPVLSPAAPSTCWSSKGEAPKTNPLSYLKCHMGSQYPQWVITATHRTVKWGLLIKTVESRTNVSIGLNIYYERILLIKIINWY